MTNIKQKTAAFILCSNCCAPTVIPEVVERNIDKYKSFDCWECEKTINFSKDFRFFVKATYEFDEDILN